MPRTAADETLERLAEINEHRSWADFGTVRPTHPMLRRYVAGYTYSIGCLRESDARLITRAFPTVMTQIYFEFCGGLSEIRGKDHGFGAGGSAVAIEKRTYIKHGLGSWFDIHQLPSGQKNRPIKNLKIDLYPVALYELFHCAPSELDGEDLHLADLLGATTTSLMLEEMEAARSGQRLIDIAERYFLDQLWQQVGKKRLAIHGTGPVGEEMASIRPMRVSPPLPSVNDTLTRQAQRFHKSERWLQKLYAEVYGISFKQIQSNLRFHQVHQLLWQTLSRGERMNLTDLAYRSGYFDQAHFIKEFKRYTGMTPGQYLKSNFDQQSQYLWYW